MKNPAANKLARSYSSDTKKDLKDKKFRQVYHKEMLKLQIAEEIIKLRKKNGITQKELADKINTTQAVISRIENAQVYPSTSILEKICQAFNVQARFKFC